MWRNRIKERTTVKAADLLDHTGNWRTHPEAQKAGMIGVLDEVGIVDALTVYYSEARDALVIIDGHLRKSIDPDQGWPVDVLDVTDAEADYILATKDPLAMVAIANREKLGALLQEVQSDEAAVQEMLAELAEREGVVFGGNGGGSEAPEPQMDRAGELLEQWQVETGQVWEIAQHRLVCGDSNRPEIIELAIQGNKPNLMMIDPPYGISVVAGLIATVGGSKPVTIGSVRHRRTDTVDATLYRPVHGDDKPFDPQPILDLAENSIIWGGNYCASRLPDSRCWIAWDKNNTGNFADAELAWTSFDRGVKLYKFTWNGLVREGPRDIEGVSRFHPTQKPVGLFSDILSDFSAEGDMIIDLYLGSGTTLLACELTKRRGIGIEMDPAYCAVTLERLTDLGLDPQRID